MVLNRIQKGSNIYAVYELTDSEVKIDRVSLMMINSNQQENIGLAPITFEEMNGIYYKMLFDITGKVTLREYTGKHISQEDFRQMLLNLIDTIEQFDEYMIDVNQILLDMDYVYINAIDHHIAFLCIALKDVTQAYRPYEFFRSVVQNSYVNLNINEVSYFNHIWNITSNESGFSLSNMKAAMQQAEQKSEALHSGESSVPGALSDFRVEEPKEITISQPKPEISFPVPAPPPIPVQPEQKGGFLGRLFSTNKPPKPKKSSFEKKPEKRPEKKPEKKYEKKAFAPSGGYQGGIAGIRNNSTPWKSKPPAGYVSPPKGISENAMPMMMKQPEMNTPVPVQPKYQETTLLKNPQIPMEIPQKPQKPIYQGTTVLKNAVSPYEANQIQANQFQQPPQETTVLVNSASVPNLNNEETVLLTQPSAVPETTVLLSQNASQETTVLNQPSRTQKTACLIRLKDHSHFFIQNNVLCIGRGLPEKDYSLNDNTHISRRHAEIIRRNDEYFLSRVTATNTTCLNERELMPGMELPLSDRDKIRLADEEFEFRIV